MKTALSNNNALLKLRHLTKGIAKGQYIHTLAYHWFGSHRMQHLIQAANTLRIMARQSEVIPRFLLEPPLISYLKLAHPCVHGEQATTSCQMQF